MLVYLIFGPFPKRVGSLAQCPMKDTQLYSQILGVDKQWKVIDVQISLADDEVAVSVSHVRGKLACPKCGKACPGYDKRQRRLRLLAPCLWGCRSRTWAERGWKRLVSVIPSRV